MIDIKLILASLKNFTLCGSKMRKTLRISLLILCIATALLIPKDKSSALSSNTNVSISITPGTVDYNVSGSITLGSFSGSVNTVLLTGTFSTGSFWAMDLSGTYYTGQKYRKISSSQMSGQTYGALIPTNGYFKILPNPSIAVTFSGTATSGAGITSYSGRADLSGLQQQPIMTLSNNSGFLYRVSITPALAIQMPAGQQIDTYKSVLTVTVPWSS